MPTGLTVRRQSSPSSPKDLFKISASPDRWHIHPSIAKGKVQHERLVREKNDKEYGQERRSIIILKTQQEPRERPVLKVEMSTLSITASPNYFDAL
jgi:hypothetical protein